MVLLDTDVVIDILRNYAPAVEWLGSIERQEVFIPGFVAMEIYQGCRTKNELARVQRVLAEIEHVWPGPETCEKSLELYAEFHLSHSLGSFDALIGQTAVSLGVPLCTFNQKHYEAISMLETIQPYTR